MTDDHAHALRVSAALAIPGAALIVVGRPELLVYAVFGSFAGMYGRAYGGRVRSVQQARGALLLVAGVTVGVTLAHLEASPAVLVATEVVFAAVASLWADRWRLRPAGPFFPIFGLGATALVPPAIASPQAGIGLCAVTALLAIGLGRVGSGGLPGEFTTPRVSHRAVVIHASRYALAVGGAGGCAVAFGFANPNWAMAAAAVPLAAIDVGRAEGWEMRSVLVRAGHRIAGTYAGLAVTAAILPMHLAPGVMAAVTMAFLFPTELFMTRNYAIAIGFFTPLIMLMTQLGAPMDPVEMLVMRGLDTLIGVAAGVVVAGVIRRRNPRIASSSARVAAPLGPVGEERPMSRRRAGPETEVPGPGARSVGRDHAISHTTP
ncbi:MAG: FUSC family protein [Gordonia sp. (in: high G+C Gram-positive bacteria)]|uniref:FUSC family protein n=1 Tax=Gordonia sp. (in: high G+C Gram-positive bacteria) TaxID=84139 RepID=UPI0039E5B304